MMNPISIHNAICYRDTVYHLEDDIITELKLNPGDTEYELGYDGEDNWHYIIHKGIYYRLINLYKEKPNL